MNDLLLGQDLHGGGRVHSNGVLENPKHHSNFKVLSIVGSPTSEGPVGVRGLDFNLLMQAMWVLFWCF